MTIKFEKTIKADGTLWYYVMQDLTCVGAFEESDKNPNAADLAKSAYLKAIEAAKAGLPYTEVLASETI